MTHLRNLIRDERGQTMAEYSVVMGVIAVGVIASLQAFGNPIIQLMQLAADAINGL